MDSKPIKEQHNNRKELYNSLGYFESNLKKELLELAEEYMNLYGQIVARDAAIETGMFPSLVPYSDHEKKRMKLELAQILAFSENKNKLINLSSNLRQRLSSDSKLNEEDERAVQIFSVYYDFVLNSNDYLRSFANFTLFFRDIESLNKNILDSRNNLEKNLETLRNSFREMLHKITMVNYPDQYRKPTSNEQSAIISLEQETYRYFERMKDLFLPLFKKLDSLSDEFEGHAECFKSILILSNGIYNSFDKFEFHKDLVRGVECDKLMKYFEEFEQRKVLFRETEEKLSSFTKSVSMLFIKINTDIWHIQQKCSEFKSHGSQHGCSILQRKPFAAETKKSDELSQLALKMLDNQIDECLRLVAITEQKDCSDEEWKLREMIKYLSPSLGCDFPKDFPPISLPEPTCCD